MKNNTKNILFIARTYPPTIGGIETQNHQLIQALRKYVKVYALTNSSNKLLLPIFYVFAFVKALFLIRKVDQIILGDAVSAPWGLLLKLLTKKPVHCIIHGLDISFSNRLYQSIVVKVCLPKLDSLIAVGSATQKMALDKDIKPTSISLIPNGVNPIEPALLSTTFQNSRILESLDGKMFFLSLGRLVKRKGVVWFIRNVVPQLDPHVLYVIAGSGPESKEIIYLSKKHQNIIFFGQVSDSEKHWLLSNATLFIQPNIPIENDIEGFGLVVLEAAIRGTPVIASNLEGLKDSIHDHKNGFLANPTDSSNYVNVINKVIKYAAADEQLGNKLSKYTIDNFNWDSIAQQYISVLNEFPTASSVSR